MKQPRVDKKSVRRYREIMTALRFPDERGRIVGVIVAAHLPAKPLNNDPGAAGAVARFMFAARKDLLVPRDSVELPFVGVPVHAI